MFFRVFLVLHFKMDGSRKVNPVSSFLNFHSHISWRISEHVKRGRPVFIFSTAQFHLFGLPTLDLTRNRTNLSNDTVLDITRNRGFGFLKFFFSSFFSSESATKRREDDSFDFNVHISKFIFGFFFRRQYIFNIFEQSIWRIIRKHLNRLNRSSPKRILN